MDVAAFDLIWIAGIALASMIRRSVLFVGHVIPFLGVYELYVNVIYILVMQ